MRRESDDIFIVKGRVDTFHEQKAVAAAGNALKHTAETVQPLFATLDYTTEFGIAVHPLGRNMELLPHTGLIQETDVETLISVILGIVYEIADAAGTFLEKTGKNRIYEKGRVFLNSVVMFPT